MGAERIEKKKTAKGAPASALAQEQPAKANVHLAPDAEKRLPHEAWHVVQQAQGRVVPTQQM